MRKSMYSAVGAAAVVLTLGAVAGTALAATTWTVSPGGAVKATSANVGITDTKTKNPLPTICNSTMNATLKHGSGLPGSSIASITSVTFSNCRWVLGFVPTTKSAHLPWHLNAQSYTASSGTTSGTVTGIHLKITGPSCSAVVDGTSATADNGRINFRYVNSSHKLTLPSSGGNLHYYQVSGCLGLVASGNPANMHGTYAFSPSQKITSP